MATWESYLSNGTEDRGTQATISLPHVVCICRLFRFSEVSLQVVSLMNIAEFKHLRTYGALQIGHFRIYFDCILIGSLTRLATPRSLFLFRYWQCHVLDHYVFLSLHVDGLRL